MEAPKILQFYFSQPESEAAETSSNTTMQDLRSVIGAGPKAESRSTTLCRTLAMVSLQYIRVW